MDGTRTRKARAYLVSWCHPLPLRGVVDGTRTRKARAYLVSWCHPLPLRGVVDGTRTRKARAYLVSWFSLTIYFARCLLRLLLVFKIRLVFKKMYLAESSSPLLHALCQEEGVGFLNMWEDGLHLNKRGAAILGKGFLRDLEDGIGKLSLN